jgi:peptide/nickel transport system substrate-binding protein
LIERNLDGTLAPSLGLGVEPRSDGKQITIHLRTAVQFHSGRVLTSDDIKWNILRVRDPAIQGGQLATFSKVFTSIDTPDPATVVLGLDAPRPVAADLVWRMNIADQQAFATDEPIEHMVGTGPFKLVEWAQGDHISMTRNTNYWQSGRPYLDGLLILMLKDAQSTGVQLESGSLDISDGLLTQDVVRLQKDSAFHVDSVDNGSVYTFEANIRTAPTSNKLVRQALQFAINRQRVVDSVLRGQGGVTAEGCGDGLSHQRPRGAGAAIGRDEPARRLDRLSQPRFVVVTRLDIQIQPFAGGRAIGPVGPYEELRGTAHIALDPRSQRNHCATHVGYRLVAAAWVHRGHVRVAA